MEDELANLTTVVTAHEVLISFLLTEYLTGRSPEQRASFEKGLGVPVVLPIPASLTDIDTADEIAGLLIKQQEAIARIVNSALARIGSS